ncbi:MAG: general secretion pathway protein D [Paraglaciecola psychrophila]|jgi:general secretion pathway protein D
MSSFPPRLFPAAAAAAFSGAPADRCWSQLTTTMIVLLVVVAGSWSLPLAAQQANEQPSGTAANTVAGEKTWTVNFKETEIQEIIRFVANTLEKTMIIDPKVKGKVQVISSEPVNAEQLYKLFLSILEVQGFAAVESGNVVRIIPAKDARTSPVNVISSDSTALDQDSSEVVTQVIQLDNISAAKLIPVLRPLAPQQAHMAAYAPSNAIIISDTSANIARIRRVIESIDLSAVQKTEIIVLEHASADEIVSMLGQLQKSEKAKGQSRSKELMLVADKRTNSVLVSGDELERARVRSLIVHLDTPLVQNGNIKVVYLKYAVSTDLAAVLSKVVANMERMGGSAKVKKVNNSGATVEADEGTNSLIITAEADVMKSLLSVVERLDIRRAQVLVEAIIVELNDGNDRDLGIEWLFTNDSGLYGSSSRAGLAGATAASVFAAEDNSAEAKGNLAGTLASIPGQVLGFGSLDDDLSFNVVINALKKNTKANILSTPSLLTLDNEEASIVVGESIPFVTGSFTSTGNSSNPDNPFQTVERENVGITLKITPQINEGDSVILAISQEVSNVQGTAALNSNLITSERKIETKVLADNGQTIVLGGLIEDNVTEEVQKVPILGDIPVLGALFRSTAVNVGKKHLLVFLKPTIVRDNRTMDRATASKYKYIRKMQIEEINRGVDLIDDGTLPLLPEWQQQIEQLQQLQRDQARAEAAQ